MNNPVDLGNPGALAGGVQAKRELMSSRPQVFGTRTSDSGSRYFDDLRRRAYELASTYQDSPLKEMWGEMEKPINTFMERLSMNPISAYYKEPAQEKGVGTDSGAQNKEEVV